MQIPVPVAMSGELLLRMNQNTTTVSFMDFFALIIGSWPLTVLILALVFRKAVLRLVDRISGMKTAGIELVLEGLPTTARKELSGLTPHDVWALNTFREDQYEVSDMKPQLKVATRSLMELGLIRIVSEGDSRRTEITDLGEQLLDAADAVL